MARHTVASLLERIEALEAEVETLREQLAQSAPQVQYVKEVTPPAPVSKPLDFNAMSQALSYTWSYYSEEGDVYRPGIYL